MALIDRLARDTDRSDHIPNHAFSAAIYFLAKGEVTRAQVITALGLTTSDEVQLDEMGAYFQALTAGEKREFHSRVEAAGILLESRIINRTKYKSLLGLT